MFDDEVFVYTPKGRIVSLPAGSTPIDFAYAIHSGVGNAMVGAKVNHRIANIDSKLKNGEIGKNNLILGYPEGNYKAEKYYYDVRQKGRGPYRVVDIEAHLEDMLKEELIDFYTYTAYIFLIKKTKSFSKLPQTKELISFLGNINVDEIVVIGHSCAIDFSYFEYINRRFPLARWVFNPYDGNTKRNIEKMIQSIGIKLYEIQ